MDLPADALSLSDIPHDFAPAPLGQRAALIAKILEIAPQADFSHPTWENCPLRTSPSSSTSAEMPSSTP